MSKLCYEINAYKKNGEAINIPIGYGKRAREKAKNLACELYDPQIYDCVYVDCHNDEELVDDECILITKSIPF